MVKKRDSQKVRKPRKTMIENRTVMIKASTQNLMKSEEVYRKMQKKAHELVEGGQRRFLFRSKDDRTVIPKKKRHSQF